MLKLVYCESKALVCHPSSPGRSKTLYSKRRKIYLLQYEDLRFWKIICGDSSRDLCVMKRIPLVEASMKLSTIKRE